MHARFMGSLAGLIALVAVLAACTTAGTTPGTAPTPGGPPASAPASASGGGAGASAPIGGDGGGSANGYEGRLVTSESYDATWTVSPDVPADPLNSSSTATLTSDKGTFGNVSVQLDGSVSFGSGASELSGQYTGTGAQVTLDETGMFVCAFTVDTDLANGRGGTVHIAGGLTVHWHPEGLGGLNCP